MVFGADVTHPGFGEDVGKPSVAAVVASTNETYTEYAAAVRAQYKKVQESTSLKKKSKTQEIITDLRDMVLDLLEKFYTVNNKALPTKIIFYRDGVSEGQYKEVIILHWQIFFGRLANQPSENLFQVAQVFIGWRRAPLGKKQSCRVSSFFPMARASLVLLAGSARHLES